MFHLTVLGSGSAGNCALVETPRCRLLVDGGLSSRQMCLRLQQCGVNPLEIDGILLTHEHSDHASGLAVWCKQFSTPIYCNRLTAETLAAATPDLAKYWRLFVTGSDFTIGDIAVQTFSVPHDAVDPVGFVFHHGSEALGFLTDLGCATKLAYERVRQVSTLLIETNHCEKLLQNDPFRPWSLKQRIMSRHGHLSNAAAAEVLVELLGSRLRRAVLGHLSRDCNTPELAIGTIRERLGAAGVTTELEILCATQRTVLPRLAVGVLS
jgi:phosphoribosyl 1,2-cyclic phosphodiesterase